MNPFTVEKAFTQNFGSQPELTVSSPGRINLIGEHTDYSGGYVFPAAVNYTTVLSISKSEDGYSKVISLDYDEKIILQTDMSPQELPFHWAKLFLGGLALSEIEGGVNVVFSGDIPVGAGMSSSASICCGFLKGLNDLFDLGLSRMSIAKVAQKVEHKFVGVQCGLMDQLACVFGKTNQALFINCETEELEYAEFDLTGYQFVLINSNVEHKLDESEYNDRHLQFLEASTVTKQIFDHTDFKKLTLEDLLKNRSRYSDTLFRRAKHLITENQRVLQTREALRSNALDEVGGLLTASHNSLKDDFQVTVLETDYLVSSLLTSPAVLGARQMGGGFGGCVILLIKDESIAETLEPTLTGYRKRFNKDATLIKIKIGHGVKVLER